MEQSGPVAGFTAEPPALNSRAASSRLGEGDSNANNFPSAPKFFLGGRERGKRQLSRFLRLLPVKGKMCPEYDFWGIFFVAVVVLFCYYPAERCGSGFEFNAYFYIAGWSWQRCFIMLGLRSVVFLASSCSSK